MGFLDKFKSKHISLAKYRKAVHRVAKKFGVNDEKLLNLELFREMSDYEQSATLAGLKESKKAKTYRDAVTRIADTKIELENRRNENEYRFERDKPSEIRKFNERVRVPTSRIEDFITSYRMGDEYFKERYIENFSRLVDRNNTEEVKALQVLRMLSASDIYRLQKKADFTDIANWYKFSLYAGDRQDFMQLTQEILYGDLKNANFGL